MAWCLLITNLDPIKFGLLFERFLNPERISMPDFDINFCMQGRDKVLIMFNRNMDLIMLHKLLLWIISSKSSNKRCWKSNATSFAIN